MVAPSTTTAASATAGPRPGINSPASIRIMFCLSFFQAHKPRRLMLPDPMKWCAIGAEDIDARAAGIAAAQPQWYYD
jgi:hypothetical protein